ncbi:MAG: Hsp20 family protein [Firmicutes bacterium]|jgi:HSP20 family protein|nr:Hsp20 family protein [Bacillota bacterium]
MFRRITLKRSNGDKSKKEDFFSDVFDTFFKDEICTSMGKYESSLKTFSVDVMEFEDKYIIEADLPGFLKENVEIEYENNYLTIKASKEDKYQDSEMNFIRRERKNGVFRRSFLVENIDVEHVEAVFKNGVLMISVKKLREGIQSRKFQIQD